MYSKGETSHKAKSKSINQVDSAKKSSLKSRNSPNGTDIEPKLKSSKQVKSIFGPSHVGDGILYSIKGKHRYKASIITKPKRNSKLLKDSYKNLEMGVVGEPIISTGPRIKAIRRESRRKDFKVSSLDTRLPRIGDEGIRDVVAKINPTTGKNLKLPTLAKSSKRLIGIYGENNRNNKSLKYRYGPSSRYKYYSKDNPKGNKSYLSKIEHSKSVNMINVHRHKALKENRNK